MSETLPKTFIYTAKSTQRVLYVKKSRKYDFSLESTEYESHAVHSQVEVPRITDFDHVYDPVHGLRRLTAPEPSEAVMLGLLKRKIELLVLFKSNLMVVWENVREY